MLHREKEIIKHMLRYCEEIDIAMHDYHQSKEVFFKNPAFRNACAMPIMQIGELAKHLPDEFLQAHPEIPWKAIKGMRNFFAHDYIGMKVEYIWQTVVEDIPELKKQLSMIQDSFS